MRMAEDELGKQPVRPCKTLGGAARHFGGCERGVSMIEFVLVFPIMILLFVGLVEFGEAFSVNRKIRNAASTVSDLVSQEGTVSNAQLQDIVSVGTELLKPYRVAPFTLRVTSVVADEENRTTVAWSFPAGGPAVGSAFALPQGELTEANSSVIVTQTAYAFRPSSGYFIGSINLTGSAFFRPRALRVVAKTD
jgi:Flp pilus assembly protein TadG